MNRASRCHATRARAAAGLAATLALVASCALLDPTRLPVGTTASEARARLGPPTGEHLLPGGTRLEYATGPFGEQTWMLDFDASGGLQSVRQVLTEAEFYAITPGMAENEVRQRIGRPGQTWRLARQRQDVWVYRFHTSFCILFQVGMGDDGRVVDAGYAPDPTCDRREHDLL